LGGEQEDKGHVGGDEDQDGAETGCGSEELSKASADVGKESVRVGAGVGEEEGGIGGVGEERQRVGGVEEGVGSEEGGSN